jgi:uncharacterized protein YbbK (DUF523 family)
VLIVSACLLGIDCRYDASSRLNPLLREKAQREGYIPVCPEQLGGLPTPRQAVFIQGGNGFDVLDGKCKVCDQGGNDLAAQLIRGAFEALKIAKLLGIRKAILKETSPSCGVQFTTSHQELIQGPGVTAALLLREGIEVISDESLK